MDPSLLRQNEMKCYNQILHGELQYTKIVYCVCTQPHFMPCLTSHVRLQKYVKNKTNAGRYLPNYLFRYTGAFNTCVAFQQNLLKVMIRVFIFYSDSSRGRRSCNADARHLHQRLHLIQCSNICHTPSSSHG